MINRIRIPRSRSLTSFRFPSIHVLSIFALGSLLIEPHLFAQAQPAQPASNLPGPALRSTPARHKLSPQKSVAPAVAPQPEQPAAPPEPVTPNWPINGQAAPASVSWGSDQLCIDATNSSLQQILASVSTQTGIAIQGVGRDERVFGTFGPGSARDILAQLLQGTGYNFVMVGDQGQGAPRQITLSARNGSGAAQTASRPNSSDSEEDVATDYPQPDPQPQAPPVRANFPPEGTMPGRIPPQMLQQMQQQQQQQMMQQQGQPPQYQPNQ
jgi:hypothetical protein